MIGIGEDWSYPKMGKEAILPIRFKTLVAIVYNRNAIPFLLFWTTSGKGQRVVRVEEDNPSGKR
jgi:hypothetical protein